MTGRLPPTAVPDQRGFSVSTPRMLVWLLDVLAVANALLRWFRWLRPDTEGGWDGWEATELDCYSPSTVLVWVSKNFDHQHLLGLWAWGLLSLVTVLLGLLLLGIWGLGKTVRRLGAPLRNPEPGVVTPVAGDPEWRLAITREVQLALEGLEQSRRTPALPSPSASEWRIPGTPLASVTRTVTPEEDASLSLPSRDGVEVVGTGGRRRRARSARRP